MRLVLSGTVMSDDWGKLYAYFGYSVIYPALVRKALEDNPEGEELVLELNSGGGSVWAGSEIYTILRNSSVQTRVEVQSLAASAASFLMLGATRIEVSPVAQVMLHRPTVWTSGNDDDHRASLEMLDSVSQSILNAYAARSAGKMSREEFAELMRKESWLHASQAMEVGLADGILYQDEDSFVLTPQVAASVGESLRMLAGGGELPDYETLRARYAAEMAGGDGTGNPSPTEGEIAGQASNDIGNDEPEETPEEQPSAEPENKSTPWQAAARLEIEKNRY